MVALIIVGHKHECGGAVLRIAQAIVVHRLVATAVAKRQYGYLAYLLTDLAHLVGLQVLDNQAVRAYQILILLHGVVYTDIPALRIGSETNVHANDPVGLDAQRLHQGTTDKAVGTRDNIIGKVMILQVVEHLQHGLVEALGVGHPREPVGWRGGILLHIGIKLGNGHAGIGLGSSTGMNHIEMVGQCHALTHEMADIQCSLAHILWRLILIVGIVKGAILQQIILEIGGIEFANKRAIHVERGNAVLLTDEMGRLRIGHILHVCF